MTYSLKEMYQTLQGEGAHSGRAALFCRFTGCNLWSGREEDRETAICQFCDTDFVGVDGPNGGQFADAESFATAMHRLWPARENRFVVFTGGEPLLQLDQPLVDVLHSHGWEIAIETNGTIPLKISVDWVCVSPKASTEIVIQTGDELKLVYPQPLAPPDAYSDLDFRHFFLQPMDGPHREDNTQKAIAYCLANPKWRLSLQTHKLMGIP